MRKLNKSIFVKKAILVHGNKYDYSKFNYQGAKEKSIIVCNIHGEFLQKPDTHYISGCPECGKIQRRNNRASHTEEFIKKATEIYGNKYDYSKVDYYNNRTKVNIICKEHGEFKQTPDNHLSKHGCPSCAFKEASKRMTNNQNIGWSFGKWKDAGMLSKEFDSYKLYIIKCWNNTEEFIKVGKTFNTIKRRYQSKYEMPYRWKVIKSIEGDAYYISKLEYRFHRMYKKYRYKPSIKFAGEEEAYVVSKEVTTQQELDRQIAQTASI